MKKLIPSVIVLVVILIFTANALKGKNLSSNSSTSTGTKTVTTTKASQKEIKPDATALMLGFNQKDMELITPYIGENGVHFKIFYTLSDENETTLYADDFKNFFTDTKKYTWGVPPSGMPLEDTKINIYNTIFDKDYSKAPFIGINEVVLHPGSSPDIKAAVDAGFPGKTTQFIEYYYPPTEEGGLDWSAVSLVFEQKENSNYLVGIFKNTWTP